MHWMNEKDVMDEREVRSFYATQFPPSLCVAACLKEVGIASEVKRAHAGDSTPSILSKNGSKNHMEWSVVGLTQLV